MAQVGNLIVVGTYEEFVLGYAIVPDELNAKKLCLVQTFACHSHRASVRSLAVGGRHLASGSADESIRLYDTINQVESGLLTHHNGTVNALAFTENGSHLISGGDDGTIAVVKTGSWYLEKKWDAAHSGSAVTGLAVHPSGKLALSIGSDNRIVTWNLVKGRRAFVTNVASRCRNGWGVGDVQWSPTGSYYAVFMASHAEVYSVATAGVSHTITCSNRVTSITFFDDNILFVGEESGEASIHKLEPPAKGGEEGEKEEIARFQAHDRRVKCARYLGPVEDASKNAVLFVTAGGSGRVCLWELQDSDVVKLYDIATGCRVTSMIVVDLGNELKLKEEEESTSEKKLSRDSSSTKSEQESKSSEKVMKRKHIEITASSSNGKKNKSSPKVAKSSNNQSNGTQNKVSKSPYRQLKKHQGGNTHVRSVNAGQWNVSDY